MTMGAIKRDRTFLIEVFVFVVKYSLFGDWN
jgi:hypothetical protein